MSLSHASSGEVIDVRPLGSKLHQAVSTALVKTARLEVIRLVLTAGKSIPEHRVAGEMTIQCIEGTVELHAHGRVLTLHAGDLVFLQGGEPYSFHAVESCSLLHTIQLSFPSLSQESLR